MARTPQTAQQIVSELIEFRAAEVLQQIHSVQPHPPALKNVLAYRAIERECPFGIIAFVETPIGHCL
jgi:hypothetical protein